MFYIGVMNKQEKVGTSAQGADTQSEMKINLDITVEMVETWLKRDLHTARHCLEAILSDPDLTRQVAIFMHGRFRNAENKQAAGEPQLN